MLTHLSIRNFALIDTLSLDFSSGLIIFTGETGAGKSIIMDALSLCLGKRGDATFIREGQDKCDVSTAFKIHSTSPAYHWLQENELLDGDECLLRRTFSREGRSKSFINGQIVSLQSLRELGNALITLHSQHEAQHLLHADDQRTSLDTFGKLTSSQNDVKQAYQQYIKLKNELEEKKATHQQLLLQQDFIQFQANEFFSLSLKEGELLELEKEQKRLAHAKQLMEGIQTVLSALDNNDYAISSLLHTQINQLSQLTQYDERLIVTTQQLESAAIQIQDVASELNHLLDKLDLDPQRLNEIDQRLSQIYALARKHQVSPYELTQIEKEILKKIMTIENNAAEFEQHELQLNESVKCYHEKASQLSHKRQEAAKKLSHSITQLIQTLGMKGGKFDIHCELNLKDIPSPTGYEKIEFLVSTNVGSSLQPLTKIVSGGELSRLSLAMSVTTTSSDEPMTFIFDEVDSGIGGATADQVGSLLKKLSEHHQILCITHVPQVATYSKQHFVVTKKNEKKQTQVHINELTQKEKLQEIARMLGGSHITQSTLMHAQEMLEVADIAN